MRWGRANADRKLCIHEMQRWVVYLWAFLLAPAAMTGARAAENAAPNASPSGVIHSVDLIYRELPNPVMHWGVTVQERSAAFQKEPDLKGEKVTRGALGFYGKPEHEVPLLWVKSTGKLYLDLNRNGDLTDDLPGGLQCAENESVRAYSQSFTNIHFSFKTGPGTYPVLADLALYNYVGSQVHGNLGWRSVWDGRVTLQGRDWQIGVIGSVSGQPGATEPSYLLFRRWEARDEAFRLNEGSLEAFAFPKNLFFGKQLYRLTRNFLPRNNQAGYKLDLTEEPSELGELSLSGRYIHRLVLTGTRTTVVLTTPEPVVRIPVGTYHNLQASLRQGGTEAYLQGSRSGGMHNGSPEVEIRATKPASLAAGGPLTNSVAITRRGKNLNLSYQLVGADGAPYQLQGARQQPSFTIHKGNKEIASGKFEFG
jgi:hypothetical protein